jgi:integrase/recombinase XerD
MEQFINKQISNKTKQTYGEVLRRFMLWCGELPKGSGWVRDYQNELLKSGLGNRSINFHITTIGTFYKYKFGERLTYDRLKEKRAQVNFLSDEEVRKILDAADGEFRTVLMFILDTGVRVGELAEISRRENSEVKSEMTLVGKGGKQRMIIVGKETLARLKPGLLFGKPWSVVMVQRRLKRLAERNGIKKRVWPHMLRHTFSVNMLNNGAALPEIQRMLGHSNIQTTMIYTHVTDNRLREVWEKCQQKQKMGLGA